MGVRTGGEPTRLTVADGAVGRDEALRRVAHAYSRFAAENPVLYDAMFTRATGLRFAAEDTPLLLRAAFAELREAVADVVGGHDVENSPRCCGLRCTG